MVRARSSHLRGSSCVTPTRPLARSSATQCLREWELLRHSHSMGPGGFDVTSSTTRLTSRTPLVMRFEIFDSTS